MAAPRDIVIVGAGHNGLVAAFYLAKAGFRPLLLERRAVVGGAAITDEFHPGFKCSTLAHTLGPVLPDIVRKMRLKKHGLEIIQPETSVLSLAPDRKALLLSQNPKKSAAEIAKFSPKDAERYPEFQRILARIGSVLGRLLTMAPPSIDSPSAPDLWKLLGTGRKFRGLGKKEMFRVLRWGPMAIADLVAECFETELLRATIAARGIFGAAMGPWSAGSSAVLLLRAAGDPHPAGATAFPRGGMGALTQAMAAAAARAGAEIRTNCDVRHISVKDERVTGVVLASGEEISASTVVSNADPHRTFFKLVDPVHLQPDFLAKMKNFRAAGTVAKVNLAVGALPSFYGVKTLESAAANGTALGGVIHIGPEIDYLERAFDSSKYGEFSRQPYLQVSIPSISDSSLAPAGKHVVSIYMQFAPYKLKQGDWNAQRAALGDVVVKTLAQYAPDLPGLIEHRQVITPLDLEQTYGLTGGHIFHGELALDQLFTMRPLLGWARYHTPLQGLYLCGSGTHPGSGLTGASGLNAAREITASLRKK